MAPHKQATSLLQLARNEVGKLVLNTCIDIDVRYSYNDPSWQEEVDSLQALLVEHIPSTEWDFMCDVVFREASQGSVKLKDSRVIYATLVHRNMKKLVVKPLCELTKRGRFYVNFALRGARPIQPFTEEDISHRDFWLQLIPKLVNVVDLNMMEIGCQEIYAAIGENSKKLERLSYGMNSDKFVDVIKNCTKLRYLKFIPFIFLNDDKLMVVHGKNALETFPDLEEFHYHDTTEILKTVVVSQPLNLRCYQQLNSTPHDLSRMVTLCPNLTTLDISPDRVEDSAEIFKTLAASLLQLKHLEIDTFHWENNIENFLKLKGNFIKSLKVDCSIPDINAAVLSIALNCKNLTEFEVNDCREMEDHQNKITTKDESLFKCLNHFEYSGSSWAIPEFFLSHSSSVLTSLKINFMSTFNFNDNMFAAFREHRWTEIKSLDLHGVVTPALLRHVYHSCPKLTHLKLIVNENQEMLDCIEYLMEQVKENNLDLHIDASKWPVSNSADDWMSDVDSSEDENDDDEDDIYYNYECVLQ